MILEGRRLLITGVLDRHSIAFAYLMTVLLFARADLYSDRNRRPGLTRIATALFQVTVIALVYALHPVAIEPTANPASSSR